MKNPFFISLVLSLFCAGLAGSVQADALVASYELSEIPPLSVTSPDTTATIVQGGTAGAPAATDGSYILKVTWTGQTDGKVEVRHDGLDYDLAGHNWLLIDVYMTTDLFAGSSNGVVGIWDDVWTGKWYSAVTIPPTANEWYTLLFDVSGTNQSNLDHILAFLFDYMGVNDGTFYVDNIRLVQQIAVLRYPEDPPTVEAGLRYQYFEGTWDLLPDFDLLTAQSQGLVNNFDISVSALSDYFGLRFTGYINIPTDGTYTFYTNSDDGSELYIGNTLVVDNDGLHSPTEQSGTIDLEAGKHAITVNFFDKTGGQALTVSYEGPGISKTAIPNNVLFRNILPGDLDYDWEVDFRDFVVLANGWPNSYTITDLGEMAENWLEGKFGVQIRDGWYYIDNEKFFVKGIGYNPGSRPGQYPWSRQFEPEIITLDMNRIIDGGFNTIRTWGALMEEELALIDSMGLKIIFGIWIGQQGDFGNPAFIAAAESVFRRTLNYSKNYDCIIAYIIMNEPMAADIYSAGAAETVSLWTRIKNIINQEHPGIPVSFSNSPAGDYINMNIFDISGHNIYSYSPPAVSHSLGYSGYINYAKKTSPKNPLVVTEYGLSVSPDGPGGYGYGGNSLQEQSDGDLIMYRGLIDGDAQGGCVFMYLDGWWKNNDIPNDADTHEPEAEEWFGLFGIEDGNSDPNGTARPAWYAMKQYNMGIITSPKNGQVYDANIPLEFFLDERVDSISVKRGSNVLYNATTDSNSYIQDTLTLNIAEEINDVNLQFEFLDANSSILKTENIVFLYASGAVTLPSLDLTVSPANLDDSSVCLITITVQNEPNFVIDNNEVNYDFYHHIGWSAEQRTTILQFAQNPEVINSGYTFPSETKILSVSAGVTVKYGDFEKRLYALKTIQRGSWANPICHKAIRY